MQTAISIAIIVLAITRFIAYAADIKTERIKPTLSSWIFYLFGTALSTVSYVLSRGQRLLSGIAIFVDLLMVVGTLGVILIWGVWFNQNLKLRSFEKWYLAGCLAIVTYGAFTGDAFGSNLLAQLLLASGYLPMCQTLVKEKRNTESYRAWSLALMIRALAFIAGLLGEDTLVMIYAVRSALLIAVVLGLMLWCDLRVQPQQPVVQTANS